MKKNQFFCQIPDKFLQYENLQKWKTLKIKLKDKINDKKTFKAILKSVDNDSLELNIGKEELIVDFGIIDICKLIPNYKEILRGKNGR